MEEGDRQTTILIIIIFAVLVIALGAIGFTIYQIINTTGGLLPQNEQRSKIPSFFSDPNSDGEDPEVVLESNTGDYSFGIGESGAYSKLEEGEVLGYNFQVSKLGGGKLDVDVPTGEKDEALVDEVINRQEEFETVEFGDFSEVRIQKIGVKAPILQGLNGDELLDQGWWLYPASYTSTQGEKILYCHRRFFGAYDPRTCWNMNQMVKGDNIQVVSTSGEILNYNVISTSIVPGTVTNVMKPSDKNYLKIVTCGTETGDPGSDQYRVVVLAELQN